MGTGRKQELAAIVPRSYFTRDNKARQEKSDAVVWVWWSEQLD